MSATSSPGRMSNQPPRRLKLKVSTPPHRTSMSTEDTVKDGSSSPVRPSYSPVTPTLSHVSLVADDAPTQQWIDQPEPLPLSLDDNPDAIALRATISILQMQRQQSLRDIRNLDRIKHEALTNPEAFVKDLRDGKLQKAADESMFDDEEEADQSEQDQPSGGNESRFGQLPTAQDIARCPPIEWSKYHIAGEPLDRLHEIQKQYPGLTEEALARGQQPRAHEITAPYRPFADKIEPRQNAKDQHPDKWHVS